MLCVAVSQNRGVAPARLGRICPFLPRGPPSRRLRRHLAELLFSGLGFPRGYVRCGRCLHPRVCIGIVVLFGSAYGFIVPLSFPLLSFSSAFCFLSVPFIVSFVAVGLASYHLIQILRAQATRSRCPPVSLSPWNLRCATVLLGPEVYEPSGGNNFSVGVEWLLWTGRTLSVFSRCTDVLFQSSFRYNIVTYGVRHVCKSFHRACVNATVIVVSVLRGSGARMLFARKYGISAVFVSLLCLQAEVRCRRSSLRSTASSCNIASLKLSGRSLCEVYACKELYVASRSFAGTRHFSPEQHESVTFASAKKAVRHVAPSNGTEFRRYTTLLSRAT